MAEEYYQSMKRLNYHNDLVLRTPTLTTGERMLMMANRDPLNSFNYIQSIAYPKVRKETTNCMDDLRQKANRNITILHEVEGLNGLFGLQQTFPTTDETDVDYGQLWAARTVNNCNLVHLPESVSELLTLGDDRKFNFTESMMTLHLRKEADNCLSAAFQFWNIPKVKKLLDEKINILVFGGKWSLETSTEDLYNDGLLALLLSAMKLQRHIMQCEHYDETFSKESFIDKSADKLQSLDNNERNTFLMQEFEKVLIECKCPADYLMDLFISDLMRNDYCVEKNQYRRRKNILIMYRGLFFLIERRFEVFMNVVLFQKIIQNIVREQISEEMILCLIRAGMVLTNVSVWKTFATARDSCHDIDSTMKYTQTAAVNAGLKKRQNKKVTNTGLKETRKVDNFSNINKTSTPDTLQTKSLSCKYKCNTDSDEERKQSGLMNVGINFDREYNPDKSFDSQETISAEMTETDTSDDMPIAKSEKGKRRIVRTSSDSEDFINPSAMKNQHAQKMLKGTSKQSHGSFASMELKSRGKPQPVFKSIWDAEESEKASTKPSQDFSGKSCKLQSSRSKILHKTISAKDKESNTNTNIISNTTHSPMLGNMDIDGTTNTRSLRPREHVDKLSEYISIHIMICNADYYMCHSEIMFCVFFLIFAN